MSTPEQHAALFLEIISEMTPEQLAEAMKPLEIDWKIDLIEQSAEEKERAILEIPMRMPSMINHGFMLDSDRYWVVL